MTRTVQAVCDGKDLKLSEPIDLEPNTSVHVTIEFKTKTKNNQKGFLQTARSLQLDGPVDWSNNLEEYLYGTSKNSARSPSDKHQKTNPSKSPSDK